MVGHARGRARGRTGHVVGHVVAHLELGVYCVANGQRRDGITEDRDNFTTHGAQRAHFFFTRRRGDIVVADAQLPREPFSFIGGDKDKRAVLEVARTAATTTRESHDGIRITRRHQNVSRTRGTRAARGALPGPANTPSGS